MADSDSSANSGPGSGVDFVVSALERDGGPASGSIDLRDTARDLDASSTGASSTASPGAAPRRPARW